jgi:MSHA type pilus biogenesis protein MshL
VNTKKARKLIILGLLTTIVSCASFPGDINGPGDINTDRRATQDAESLVASHDQVNNQSKSFLTEQDKLRELLEHRAISGDIVQPVMPGYDPLDEIMVTLNVDNGDIQYVLQALARQANMNLLVHPQLSETPVKISLHFNDTPASTVFRHILRIADLSGKVENNLLIVNPLSEQVFHLDFLETLVNSTFSSGGDVLGAAKLSGSGASGGSNPLTGEFSISGKGAPNSNPYDDLEKMLAILVGSNGQGSSGGGKMQSAESLKEIARSSELESARRRETPVYSLNRMTGTLFVRARPSVIDSVGKLVQRYTKVLSRQILIEAQILEVSLTDKFKHGINWSLLRNEMVQSFGSTGVTLGGINTGVPGAIVGQPAITIPQTNLGSIGASSAGLAYANQDLAVAVNLLKRYGSVKVLSNPTIRSKHGQPALISVGRSISYVSGSSSAVTQGTASISQQVTVSSVFDGLMLGMVPFIADGQEVSLVVQPIQSSVSATSLALVPVGTTAVTLPQVDLKEMTTSLRLHNRDTVILGGLIDKTASSNNDRVPVLSEIPVFGYLFKSKEETNTVRELVVILRVTIL